MKHLTIILSLFTLHFSLFTLPAAVPVRWTVETSRVQPAVFEAYQGETLDLAASLQSYGRPVSITGDTRLYWQTNGMGARWWTAPASVSSNVLSAVWSPTNDVGARSYSCFIGQPGSNYRAEFQLRLRPSPGASPNQLPLPTVTYDARLNGTPTINGTNLIDYVVAASGAEVDPTVPDWAKQPEPPQSGTDENAVRGIVGQFAATGTVFRTSSVGDAETWTDATGCVWRAVHSRSFEFFSDTWLPVTSTRWEPATFPAYLEHDGQKWTLELGSAGFYTNSLSFEHGNFTVYVDKRHYHDETSPDNYNVPIPPLYEMVGRVALTNDLPSTPADIGAAPASVATTVSEIGNTVSAWQTYWDGDDVRVTVTNYYGSIDIPHLYIEQKMPADEQHDEAWFKIIWDEMTRHQSILQRIAALETAMNDKADRAWGFYDSSTGEYAPDGYTSISSSNILIASGMAYQKTVTTDGDVWVLTATEPTTISGVTSNGFFRITDGDGNALFEIVKGDKRTVGATAGGITVDENFVHITYSVVSDDPPQIEMTQDLRNGNWSQLSAAVSWTGQSGAWVAHVEKPNLPRAFFRATYQLGAETYIKNSAPISAGGGILCTDGIHKCRPVYNNGSITWEVVQ